jgi:hypothetical protein
MKLEEAIKEARKAEGTFRFSSSDGALIRALTDAAEKWDALDWYNCHNTDITEILSTYRKAKEGKK